jgi:hypothetical protein
MIKLYNNIFSDAEKDQIEAGFANNFPWYLSTADNHASVTKDVAEQYKDQHTLETPMMTNFLFIDKPNSPYYEHGAMILEAFCNRANIPIKKLIRIKANLQLQQQRRDDQYTTPHVDGYFPHMVMIYYVNDSDGCTLLFDQDRNITERIVPVRGNCLLFSGNILHSSQTPVKTSKRIVVNYNFA